MEKDSSLKIRCFLLALIYSASFMCFSSLSKKKTNNEKTSQNLSSNVIFDVSSEDDDKIFFGSEDEVINEYYNEESSFLAYIIDERNNDDPNYQIYNSHLIRDKETMKKILYALIKYEEMYPSDWDRTMDSMYKEWCIHNLCYDLCIDRDRTFSVDLNNDDEEDYNNNKFLKLYLKGYK